MKSLLALAALIGLGYYIYDINSQLKDARRQVAELTFELNRTTAKPAVSTWFAQRLQERPVLEPPNRAYRKPERYDDEARRRGLEASPLEAPARR